MKEVAVNKHTAVLVSDEPGAGGAHHHYLLGRGENPSGTAGEFGHVSFQNGPIVDVGGVNGCTNEDLLAIVGHRLECFQAGDFACKENEVAMNHVYEALEALEARTAARQKRGVEGTHQK